MIRVFIIENNQKLFTNLYQLLDKHFKEVEIVGIAGTLEKAEKLLRTISPDIVFLGISLPDGKGYDIYEKINLSETAVIFISHQNTDAVKAFNYEALYYLQAPIERTDIVKVLTKFYLKNQYKEENKPVNTINVFDKEKKQNIPIKLNELIKIANSEDGECLFFFKDGSTRYIKTRFKSICKKLENINYIHISEDFIVNLYFLKQVVNKKLILQNNLKANLVAHEKETTLFKNLQKLSLFI